MLLNVKSTIAKWVADPSDSQSDCMFDAGATLRLIRPTYCVFNELLSVVLFL